MGRAMIAPTPMPTASAVACDPRTHACDRPDGSGANAAGIFMAVAVGLLVLAWLTGRR